MPTNFVVAPKGCYFIRHEVIIGIQVMFEFLKAESLKCFTWNVFVIHLLLFLIMLKLVFVVITTNNTKMVICGFLFLVICLLNLFRVQYCQRKLYRIRLLYQSDLIRAFYINDDWFRNQHLPLPRGRGSVELVHKDSWILIWSATLRCFYQPALAGWSFSLLATWIDKRKRRRLSRLYSV